jgi:tRNA pseudouridine38-40 synthase
MQKAAAYLVGEHDFKSFASVHMQSETSVRTIYRCEVTRDENDIITMSVTGNGFLYNMVRIIAGTLVKVGTGDIAPEAMEEILAARDRSAAGPTAPANGLTMIGLDFSQYLLDRENSRKYNVKSLR